MDRNLLAVSLFLTCFLTVGITKKGLSTPTGPAVPYLLEYKVSEPKHFPIGKPFVVSFSIKAILADIREIEIKPYVSGDMLLVESVPAWKGLLKKGEVKRFDLKFLIPKTTKGPVFRIPFFSKKTHIGIYGVCISSQSWYRDLREYCNREFSGMELELEMVLERIAAMEKMDPVYQDCFTEPLEI